MEQDIGPEAIERLERPRADVSSVFMTLARRALAAASANGMPPGDELKRLARWCGLHRHELLRLSKTRVDAESRQRGIWLHELASMPTGRWADLRIQLAPFIRTFGLPPRSQSEPFLSTEPPRAGDGLDGAVIPQDEGLAVMDPPAKWASLPVGPPV